MVVSLSDILVTSPDLILSLVLSSIGNIELCFALFKDLHAVLYSQ